MCPRAKCVSVVLLLAALASCTYETETGSVTDAGPTPTVDGVARRDGHGSDGSRPCTDFLEPAAGAPAALIITSPALRASFQRYADLHSVTGIPTEVVTLDAVCTGGCNDADPTNDTPRAIKDYLMQRQGLSYVVLGGDIEAVPSRRVHDEYTNPISQEPYVADFYTDYYYSDFSEWDQNGDGRYADDGVDAPGYLPSVPVSRVPVSAAGEADAYFGKVVQHLTAYDGAAVGRAALVSNVATRIMGIDIDSAFYFEAAGKTLSLLPPGFSIDKLYATTTVDGAARPSTAENQIAAITGGLNLIVHSGHGGVGFLTTEVDGSNAVTAAMAYALTNATYPILLSCACQAGDFSAADSAGEQFVNAPAGGGVAYLGNVPVGLGIAGGMQLIDEILRHIQATPEPILGDAYLAGHERLPDYDTFRAPVIGDVQVVDRNSYEWTQKSVTLLGDLLIPVWKDAREPAPALHATREEACGGSRITFTFAAAVSGTLRFKTGAPGAAETPIYELPVTGTEATVTLRENPSQITAGLTSPGRLHGFYELTL